MDIRQAISERRSIRAYRTEAPPRDMILEILSDAQMAPSASNLQPWEFVVVTGDRLRALREHLMDLRRRTPVKLPSFGSPDDPVPDHIWRRQRELGRGLKQVVEAMGREHLIFVVEGSLSFYHAPLVVLILIDRALARECLLDIGLAAGNLLLSAMAHGLGSCPIGIFGPQGPEIIRFLGMEERKRLALAIGLGYPDETSPVNAFRSQRAPLEEALRWLE